MRAPSLHVSHELLFSAFDVSDFYSLSLSLAFPVDFTHKYIIYTVAKSDFTFAPRHGVHRVSVLNPLHAAAWVYTVFCKC